MSDTWTFLTNHARVLLCIARDPHVRMLDIAEEIGIRERSVQQIVADLEQGGYLSRERDGRRNTYTVHRRTPFRHAAEAQYDIGELLEIFAGGAARRSSKG